MNPQLKRKNEATIRRLAAICGAMGPHAKKHRKRWSINEDIAHRRNEGKPLGPIRHETDRKKPPRSRAKLIAAITERLYRTNWGKHHARQGQIHAAAKQLAQASNRNR